MDDFDFFEDDDNDNNNSNNDNDVINSSVVLREAIKLIFLRIRSILVETMISAMTPLMGAFSPRSRELSRKGLIWIP